MHLGDHAGIDRDAGEQRAHDSRIGQVDDGAALEMGGTQAIERQQQHLGVGFEPGVAVDLGAELQRLAGGMRAVGPDVDDRAAIAQPRDTLPVQQVCIDARDLRRGVGAQAHAAPGQLVDQFEGLKIERFAGA